MIREYLKSNRGILFVGIVLLIAGLGLNVWWFIQVPRVTLLHPLNFLPGLITLLVWSSASAYPRRRLLFIVLGVLLVGVGTIIAYFGNTALLWVVGTTPNRNTARYEEVLASYPVQGWVAHFPGHIPDNAERARLYYLPNFMQGGTYLQLRYGLPPTEVDSILERYLPIARQVENGAGDVIRAEDEQNPLRGTLFRDERNKDFAPLPEDFLVLILDATPPENWNHGCSRGVAVSTQRQEVIYWAECW